MLHEVDPLPSFCAIFTLSFCAKFGFPFKRGQLIKSTGYRMLENHFFSCSLSRLKRKAEILIAVCNEFAVKRSLIYEPGNGKPYSEVRAMAALIIQDYEGITLSALSKELRRDVSALSQSAGRLRKRMRNNQALQNRQESVVELIKTPKCQHCPRLSDSIFGWSANQIIGTIKQLMPDITKFTSGSDNEAGQSK